MKDETIYIYGRHAVMEALMNKPEVVSHVFLDKADKDIQLHNLISKSGVTLSQLNPRKLPGGLHISATHQGVVASINVDTLMVPYKEFIKNLDVTDDTALLILGEVQDPHNVGAVIRSAAAFGISGVLIPPHNQAPVTGTVVKVSAGMAFRVPLVGISNVNAVARDLKKRDFWIYGLEGEAELPVSDETFDKPSAFILGNEATGLRKKTREVCDTLLSVPIHPQCESMNAAASTAVALYAWSAQHSSALKWKKKSY